MFKFLWRLFRYTIIAALGAAAAAKLILESRAEPTTEEIDLVSIFEGRQLVSEADPFFGGKVLGLFSGTYIDLRKVEPAPTGIHIDLALVCSGLSIVVPEGWRLNSSVQQYAAGVADATRTGTDPDAVTVNLTGFAVCSGVSVSYKPVVEVVR